MKTVYMQDVLKEAENQSVVCITTNGVVKKDGCLVMGKGIAKEFADLVPGVPRTLGSYVKASGNQPYNLGSFHIHGRDIGIVSFPTKASYKDSSHLSIVKESAQQLRSMADHYSWTKIYVPAPGCGLGGLKWDDVKPVLEQYFDDRFTVVFRADKSTAQQSVSTPKGHLQLTSIGNLKHFDLSVYPKKLFIVRSPGKSINALDKYGLVHVPQLSPSKELFMDYSMLWKQGVFNPFEEEAMLKGSTGTWWDLYVPRFIKEMKERDDFQLCIKRVMELLDQGVNVMMVCFCPEFNRCHRGIIGYFIAKKGYEVRWN